MSENKDKKSKDLKQRIGIIGAGASGLAVAEALRERGYTNLFLLEKRKRAGGQALSKVFMTPSGKEIIYELGSLQPVGVGPLHKLIKRYKLTFGRTITAEKPAYFRLYNINTHKVERDFSKYFFGQPMTFKNSLDILHDVMVLTGVIIKYRTLFKPGYQLSEQQFKELSQPYEQWVDDQHFRVLGDDFKVMIGSMSTFANGGNKHDVPALKIIKMIIQCLRLPLRYINGSYVPLAEGYQELWNRIANTHNVIYDAEITHIVRENNVIKVATKNENYTFDKLIVSCAPNEVLGLFNEAAKEEPVFSKLSYCPGWRAAFTAKNVPHDAAYLLTETYLNEEQPGLAAFVPEGQVDEDTWLYGAILAENRKADIELILSEAERMLREEFKATDIKWIESVYWEEYGSHFPSQDIKEGIHFKVEALQGNKNTYFVGESISGGTHAVVSAYAYELVDKYF